MTAARRLDSTVVCERESSRDLATCGGYRTKRQGLEAERNMAGTSHQAAVGRQLCIGLIGGLTGPASAQQVPLPTPAPQPRNVAAARRRRRHPGARPGAQAQPPPSRGSPAFLRGGLNVARQPRPPRPTSTPSSARWSTRSAQYLSRVHIMSGNFAQVGADGRRCQRQFLHSEAGQGPLRVRPAEPDRHHRRRPFGGRARPQAGDAGPLSAVADAAALPAGRPHRPDARHQRRRRASPTTCSSRRGRGEARR